MSRQYNTELSVTNYFEATPIDPRDKESHVKITVTIDDKYVKVIATRCVSHTAQVGNERTYKVSKQDQNHKAFSLIKDLSNTLKTSGVDFGKVIDFICEIEGRFGYVVKDFK